MHDPEVLILDEPFSGLDPLAVDVVAGVLQRRAAEGAAVLFSSHQLDVVERLCDDLVIIAGGTIRAAGARDSLRAQHSTRRFELVSAGDAGLAARRARASRSSTSTAATPCSTSTATRRRSGCCAGPSRREMSRASRRSIRLSPRSSGRSSSEHAHTPQAPSTAQSVWLVAEREIGSKIRSKAFLISTIILFLGALALVVWGGIQAGSTSGTPVAVTADAQQYVQDVPGLEVTDAADRAEAEALVESGDVDAAIVGDSSSPLGFAVVADYERADAADAASSP